MKRNPLDKLNAEYDKCVLRMGAGLSTAIKGSVVGSGEIGRALLHFRNEMEILIRSNMKVDD